MRRNGTGRSREAAEGMGDTERCVWCGHHLVYHVLPWGCRNVVGLFNRYCFCYAFVPPKEVGADRKVREIEEGGG